MDTRQLAAALARQSGDDPKQTAAAIQAVAAALAESCASLDSVAIPGFGNFNPTKRDEHVEVDPVSQTRTLYPPSVSVDFRPSVLLRKRMNRQKGV